IFRVAQHREEHLVELEISAAGVRERTDRRPIGLAQVLEHLRAIGVDARIDRRRHGPPVERGRRGDRYLRRPARVRLKGRKVLEHRMTREADLARDGNALAPAPSARERDALLEHVLLDAVEAPEEIEMPPRTPEFPVGDSLKAERLLLRD